MVITNKIKIELSRRENIQTIDAVQGDSCTRVLEFSLYSGGQKWDVPEGAEVWVGYCGDGGKGMYSKLGEAEDAEPAYSVNGNVVTVTLIPQVTAVAGHTELNVMFRNEDTGQQIATFSVTIRIARNPATGAGKPKDYFDIRQWVGAGPLIVTVTEDGDGYKASVQNPIGYYDDEKPKIFSAIRAAVDAGRDVICQKYPHVMSLNYSSNTMCVFWSRVKNNYRCVSIYYDENITFEEVEVANASDLKNYATLTALDDYAKTSDLDSYAQTSDLDSYALASELKDYAKKSDLDGYAKEDDFEGYAKTSDLDDYAKTDDLKIYAKTSDLQDYAKTSELRNPLYVYFNQDAATGVYAATASDGTSLSFNDIQEAYQQKLRDIIGVRGTLFMPLQYLSANKIRFQSTNEHRYDYIEMTRTGIEYRTGYYSDGAPDADDKYFNIDYDGIISLKPDYQASGSMAYSLPERLIIPDNVGGEQVIGFQAGMFSNHQRIKSVVLPQSVTKIPDAMFHKAIYLEKVENTEQIESIGDNAFSWTRIRDIRLPNLTSAGISAFENCSCLITADLGNIAIINNRLFAYCENLSEVLGGSNVTSIGERAFYSTRRLSGLPFLANLTSIGNRAFFSSRCDFEEVYDALVAKGCSFGDLATYKQYGGEDYWSGTTFTPCKTPLNSLFHQRNPEWKDTVITDEILDGDNPSTYGKTGCAFISLAEIYSAFEDVSLSSPVEFANILDSKGLLGADYNFRSREGWCAIANALGYNTVILSNATSDPNVYDPLTKDELQQIYDALAGGALVYRSTAATNADGGHATLWYGVNSDGEFLFSDTSMHCDEIGIYENHKSAWHTYKNGSQKCGAVIVTKGGKT